MVMMTLVLRTKVLGCMGSTGTCELSGILLSHIIAILGGGSRDRRRLVRSLGSSCVIETGTISCVMSTGPRMRGSIRRLRGVTGLVSMSRVRLFSRANYVADNDIPGCFNCDFSSKARVSCFGPVLASGDLAVYRSIAPGASRKGTVVCTVA